MSTAAIPPNCCTRACRDCIALNRIEKSLQAALSKTPARIKPLLKRDQAWFNAMMLAASETVFDDGDDEQKQAFVEWLRPNTRSTPRVAFRSFCNHNSGVQVVILRGGGLPWPVTF